MAILQPFLGLPLRMRCHREYTDRRMTVYSQSFLTGTLTAVILAGAIPCLCLYFSHHTTTDVIGALSVAAFSAIRLALFAARLEPRLTLFSFYVFVYTFLGIQPLVSETQGAYPHGLVPTSSELESAYGLIWLGICAYEVTYHFRLRPAWLKSPPCVLRHGAAFGVPAIVSMVLTGLAIARLGIDRFILPRGSAIVTDAEQWEQLVLLSIARTPVFVLLLFIIFYRRRERVRNNKPYRWLLISVGIVNIFVSNPVASSRFWFGCVLLSVLYIHWAKVPRSLRGLAPLGLSLFLLIAFSALDPRVIVREYQNVTAPTVLSILKDRTSTQLRDLSIAGDFDVFSMILATTRYVGEENLSWGRQILLPIAFYIPRWIWPDKPVGSGHLAAHGIGLKYLNRSCPLWAEGYINFGWVGVILFLGVYGALSVRCDRRLMQFAGCDASALGVVASVIFAANSFILLRGDLNTGTSHLIVAFACALAIDRWITRRGRTSTCRLSSRQAFSMVCQREPVQR